MHCEVGTVRDYKYFYLSNNVPTFSKDVNGGVNLAVGLYGEPVPEQGILNVVNLFKTSGAQAVDVRVFSRNPAESDVINGGRFDLTRNLAGGKLTIGAGATAEISGVPNMPYDLQDDQFEISVLRYTITGQPTAGDT